MKSVLEMVRKYDATDFDIEMTELEEDRAGQPKKRSSKDWSGEVSRLERVDDIATCCQHMLAALE